MSELVKTLRNYADSDYLPMHMPGHKRRLGAGEMGDPFFIDITEIDGTDNLHHAEGVLKYVQEQVKDFGKNAVMIGRALSFRGDALSGKWKYLRNTDGHQRLCKPGRNDPAGKKQS